MKRVLFILVALLVLSSAQAFEANMYVFAVTDAGKGIPATLTVRITPGNGAIAIDLGKSLVGESTQESVRDAIRAATKYADVNMEEYDFYVRIDSPAEQIDGPSAGLPIALTTYAALKGMDVPDTVGVTGEIDADGTVYPVGGVFEKAKAAHEVGVKIFLIPLGERNAPAEIEEEIEPGIVSTVVKTVDLVQYAAEKWNMNVYEVGSLEGAIKIVFEGEVPETNVTTEEVGEREVPDFVPPPATVTHSGAFKEIADKIVQEAEDALNEAKNCDLILKDAATEEALKSSLITAESMVKKAKELSEKGYYYTAANYGFLAKIDAETYTAICEHPSVLDPNSLAFQDLFSDTQSQIESLGSELQSASINKENYEWIGAARDRYIRAKAYFDSMSEGVPAGAATVRQIYSIREWIASARMLYQKGEGVEGQPLGDIDKLARDAIKQVEDIQHMVDITNPSVAERIAWARAAYDLGWYYTASIEAMSAYGLAMGDVLASRADPVKKLAEEMADAFEPVGIWDELYLNHAKYYYEAAKHYKRNGMDERAKDMAKTGLGIYKMAESINKIHKSIEAAPTVVVEVKKNEGTKTMPDYAVPVAAAILVLSILGLILLASTSKKDGETLKREHELRRRIVEIEREIKNLERRAERDPEAKKRIRILKMQLGRARKTLEKIREQH